MIKVNLFEVLTFRFLSSISSESKKKKTKKKATGVSEGGNGTDSLKTFIDYIIMKADYHVTSLSRDIMNYHD